MESEFPSTAIPRQPTFTPVDNSRLPRRDRVQQGSVRDDDVQGPPRPAPARPNRPNRPRPEPMGEDPELQDRIQFGSAQAERAPRPGPGWNEYPASGFPGQAWPVGSGQVPLGAPVMVGARAPSVGRHRAGFTGAATPPRPGAAAALGEPDELFRAWQGSVREAAAPRRPWSASRPGTSSRRRRALQVATIGVPAAVIVTVGAGALMMLTGKANEMLAPRSNTGAVPRPPPPPRPPRPASPVGERRPARLRRRDPGRVPRPARRRDRRLDADGRRRRPGRRRRRWPPGDLAQGRERPVDAGIGGHPGRGGRPGEPRLGRRTARRAGSPSAPPLTAGRRSRWCSPPPTA